VLFDVCLGIPWNFSIMLFRIDGSNFAVEFSSWEPEIEQQIKAKTHLKIQYDIRKNRPL
jgi:hypothetical protein